MAPARGASSSERSPRGSARPGLPAVSFRSARRSLTPEAFVSTPVMKAAPSGYAWVANHGLDGAAYQAEFNALSAQGYRLIKISGYSVGGQDYYASIWTMAPGPGWVGMHGVSGDDYQAQFTSLTAQGLRPVDISGYEVGGSARYAALFEASSVPAYDARHGIPGGDYQAVADANIASGLRRLRVSGFTVSGATYFASIWVTDDGTPWSARHGLDNAGFQAEFDSQTSQGLRLVDISGYESNGADYYTATFDASPTAFWISHHNMSNDAYQAAFNENGAAGYMLTHIAGRRRRPGSLRRHLGGGHRPDRRYGRQGGRRQDRH